MTFSALFSLRFCGLGWALVCGLVLLQACSQQNHCSDNIYADAHSRKNDSSSYEKKSCRSYRQANGVSDAYVIREGRVYYREEQSSSYGTCRGNVGSHSSAGRSVCPFGTGSDNIETRHLWPLEGAPDPKNFRSLGSSYGVDQGAMYYQQRMVSQGEALPPSETLRTLPQLSAPERLGPRNSSYVVYGTQVFYKGKPVDGADAASFEALYFDNEGNTRKGSDSYYFWEFARDRHRMYWQGRVLDGSDPQSFEVVSGSDVKDRNHRWNIDLFGWGEVVKRLPTALGAGYFKSTFTDPNGQPYVRLQWHETLKGGLHLLRPLPYALPVGTPVQVLPLGCQRGDRYLAGHAQIPCGFYTQEPTSTFIRAAGRIFFQDMEVLDADADSFRPFMSVRFPGSAAVRNAQALDAKALYSFEPRHADGFSRIALQGDLSEPIPDRYGYFDMLADASEIYQLGSPVRPATLCRYEDGASVRQLQPVARDYGKDGKPYLVLANQHYQYVFYDQPMGDDNPSHVVDLRTGQRLPMAVRPQQWRDDCRPVGGP